MTPALAIDDLHVSVDDREILRGVSLEVAPGSIHALMGPNGSGKSTLAQTLLANPAYRVTGGRILLKGEDITALPTDERAARGLFLGFQHPEEIPGVSVFNFLRQAMARRKGIDDFSVLEVRNDRPDLGILTITHYQRILDYLVPDVVHVLVDGRIVATGGADLAREVEGKGFDAFREAAA
jgi:Fe-S cluster assembly ATPase SufC